MSCYIGEFHKVHYQPILKNYTYHRIILCLLGKDGFKNIIWEAILADNNVMMTEFDYDEPLKIEFDMEIESE